MGRFRCRVLAAGVAGGFAVALAVASGAPAGAAPASGQIDSMSDLKGAWVTTLIGFEGGDPASWQHRLTVRKVKGSAAVAWEEWRNCAQHRAACKANTATGGGWSAPSRILLVMDAQGTVHGVGATGTLELTPGTTGMTAVMLGAGQQDPTASATSTDARLTPKAPSKADASLRGADGLSPTNLIAMTGVVCPS